MRYITFLAIFFCVSCSSVKKTRKEDSVSLNPKSPLVQAAKNPIKITDELIIFDVREAFEFNILHIKGAKRLSWEEFSYSKSKTPGLLKTNKIKMVKRLARLGVSPKSKVLILGNASDGNGEEGRLAWTLYYLGVKNVQTLKWNQFKELLTSEKNTYVKPVPFWKPKPNKSLITDVKKLDQYSNKIKIIDTRSPEEALKYPLNFESMNIYWMEFFKPNGRVDLELKTKLYQVGLRPSNEIVVVSQKGISSAAVLMALLSMGYDKVSHVEGGILQFNQSGEL